MQEKDLTLGKHHPHNVSGPPPVHAEASALASQLFPHKKGGVQMQTGKPLSRRSFLRTTAVASLGLTLAGLAAPAAAADQVPFTASTTIVVTSVTRLPGGLTQYEANFSGAATYLGNVTGTGTRLQDKQGNFSTTGCLVGANGKDSVCFASNGRVEGSQGSCIATFTGSYTVTGGTGAFATATGSGTVMGQADFCTGASSVTQTGTISQPHSG
jgi:hypothetical protein